MRSFLPWLALLAACAGVPDGTDDGDLDADLAVCAGGEERVALVSSLTFSRAANGVTDGFDLDGVATESGQGTGCGVADMVGPDGATGIDNVLANLVPVLEQTEAGALEPLIQYAINEGGMMVLLRWHGIDDPMDDTCVTVETMEGAGSVFVGTSNRLLSGQTVDVDPEGPRSRVDDGRIEDGALLAGPLELTVRVAVLDAEVTLTLRDVRVRLSERDDGTLGGIIGGGIDIVDVMGIANIPGVADYVAELIGPLLTTLADMAPDENGTCTRLSFAANVEAVPVFLYEDADALTP